jgi:hypothetical protein
VLTKSYKNAYLKLSGDDEHPRHSSTPPLSPEPCLHAHQRQTDEDTVSHFTKIQHSIFVSNCGKSINHKTYTGEVTIWHDIVQLFAKNQIREN